MMMKKSVAGIIFNEDKSKLLMIKRRDIPVWVLPGGGIDQGEEPEFSIVRELSEETGCNVCIVRKVAEYIPINRLTKYTFFYECKIHSGTPTIGSETSDVQFFQLEALPTHIPPPYHEWIKDALANYPYPIIKKMYSISYPLFFKLLLLHPVLVMRFVLSRLGIHLNN